MNFNDIKNKDITIEEYIKNYPWMYGTKIDLLLRQLVGQYIDMPNNTATLLCNIKSIGKVYMSGIQTFTEILAELEDIGNLGNRIFDVLDRNVSGGYGYIAKQVFIENRTRVDIGKQLNCTGSDIGKKLEAFYYSIKYSPWWDYLLKGGNKPTCNLLLNDNRLNTETIRVLGRSLIATKEHVLFGFNGITNMESAVNYLRGNESYHRKYLENAIINLVNTGYIKLDVNAREKSRIVSTNNQGDITEVILEISGTNTDIVNDELHAFLNKHLFKEKKVLLSAQKSRESMYGVTQYRIRYA